MSRPVTVASVSNAYISRWSIRRVAVLTSGALIELLLDELHRSETRTRVLVAALDREFWELTVRARRVLRVLRLRRR